MGHDVYIAGANYKDVSIVTLTDAAGRKYRYIDEEEAGDGFFTLDIEGDLIPKKRNHLVAVLQAGCRRKHRTAGCPRRV